MLTVVFMALFVHSAQMAKPLGCWSSYDFWCHWSGQVYSTVFDIGLLSRFYSFDRFLVAAYCSGVTTRLASLTVTPRLVMDCYDVW